MNKDLLEAQQLYNNQAETFSQQQTEYSVVQDFKQKIYHQLGNLAGKKVLFTGCGDGRECIFAVNQGAHVTGIDISDKLIDAAKNNCPNARFFVMDHAHQDFADNSFDIIISLFSVMYTEDLKALLKEFRRLLSPNGKIVIAVPHPVRKMVKYNAMNYFVKGKQYEQWKGIERFGYYRLFEDYVAAFIAAGLKLHTLLELQPIKETESTPDTDVSYPHFLMFTLIKD